MKKWWLILSLCCMVLTIPSMIVKHQIESSSQTVETVMDYDSLLQISNQSENPKEELRSLLDRMKKMNIHSMGVPLYSFSDLEKRGIVSIRNGKQLQSQLFGSALKQNIKSDAQYILLLDNTYEKEIEDIMKKHMESDLYQKYKKNNQVYYEVQTSAPSLFRIRFEPLQSDIALLQEKGFQIVTLVPNVPKEQRSAVAKVLQHWKQEPISSTILFQGNEVFGYPDEFNTYESLWRDYTLIHPEIFDPNSRQKGMQTILQQSHYHGVRAHVVGGAELHHKKNTAPVLAERFVKAIHERNMRMLYIGIASDKPERVKQELETLQTALKETEQELQEKGYHFGKAKPFTEKESVWVSVSKFSLLLATGFLFAFLIQLYFPIRYAWIGFGSYVVGSIGLYTLSSHLLWTVLPFGYAVLFPIVVASFLKHILDKKDFTLWQSLLLFIGVSLFSVCGALSLTSIFASLPYILYVQQFRGVALSHLLPIVIVATLLLFTSGRFSFYDIWKLMKTPIRFYHAVIVLVLLAFGYYYLSRTGNGGTMLPFEAAFRSILQDVFGVRPRTKEILFAHPLLLVTIVYWSKQKWVKWFLPIAMIGQISIVNTFTHLHTPLTVSLIRELYGIGLGLLVGLILIGLISIVLRVKKPIISYIQKQYEK